MILLASIAIAILTAAVTLLCAGVVAQCYVWWYHVSNFEGGAGYMVVFVAMAGGIVGFILGIVVTRFVVPSNGLGFLKALGTSTGIVVGVAGICAGVFRVLADIPPRIGGRELELCVEFRLPIGEGSPVGAEGEAKVRLGSVVRHVQRASEEGTLDLAGSRLEDGRWVVPGKVFLFTRRGYRVVDFTIGGTSRGGFMIPVPRRPGVEFETWSKWFPNPRPGQPPWPESKASVRFRVERIIPPPPPPDPEVVKTEQFAALASDAPLLDWLGFIDSSTPVQRYEAIMKVVAVRQAELAQLIRSSDSRVREEALSVAERLPTISPEVADAVVAEGRLVADGVRRFNDMPSDDPTFHDVQVQLRMRFSYWHHAWWRVHQITGVDGRPPVQEILDLAQLRAKETTMDEIVINAQAHLGGIKPKAER